jgi:phosphoribosylglycinamide formyltransferase-1
MPRPRLAILLSGAGRTLSNLADHVRRATLPADIALVIASAETPGAAKARQLGIPTHILPGRIPAAQLESLLNEHRIDWVVLAGYLHLLDIPASYRGRVVNIHPALLPRHGGQGMFGRRVHEAVLAAGDTQSGCTVHLCDEQYDKGRIVLQHFCPVCPGDTPETLAARVFELECEAYPAALRQLIEESQR